MSTIKAYILDNYVKKDGTTPVKLWVYIKRRIVINTGVFIEPEYWDPEKEKVISKHKEAKDLNLIINSCKARANDIFVRYRLQHEELTPEIFLKEYKNPTTYIDFYAFWTKTMENQKKILSVNTLASHASVLNKLKKFKKKMKFSEINEELINNFTRYLKISLKNNNNTIQKNLGTIKAYLNHAKRQDIIRKSPFENIKVKKFKADRIYLTEEELKKLIKKFKKESLSPALHQTLRYFLFACFTGLRISDIKRVKVEDIINDILIVQPYKLQNVNAEIVKIPLNKSAKNIIKDILKIRQSGTIFNCFADQVTNRYLKDIATAAEIPKEITSHVARHTFATLFLDKTNDVATLQKLLGHSKIEMTMVYAHVSEKKKIEQMKVFDGYI